LACAVPFYHRWTVDRDPTADAPDARKEPRPDEIVERLAIHSDLGGKLFHRDKVPSVRDLSAITVRRPRHAGARKRLLGHPGVHCGVCVIGGRHGFAGGVRLLQRTN